MIIVLLDEFQNLSDFYKLKTIKVYQKEVGVFRVIKEMSNISPNTSNIQAFRAFLNDLIKEFGTNKIIVGSQITGIPFHYFAKEGYDICEADEFSEELLEQIQEDYIDHTKNSQNEQELQIKIRETEMTPIVPTPIDDADNYFLDFIRIQKYLPEISSKKAILPFLSNESFQTLKISCSHVMPWMENYFTQNKNLHFTYKRENGIYTILITHS